MLVDGLGGRRRAAALAIALGALACALLLPSIAVGYTVDSTADDSDALLGDEVCSTEANECTLRAAIEEANSSLGEFDEIVFDEDVFNGQPSGTIKLGSSLPPIVDRGFINGRECATAAGVGGPCVGIEGLEGADALTIGETEEVEIWGLAITGALAGIAVESSEFVRIRASWFGVELDGNTNGNTTGVLIGPESDNARVGGEGPEAGNVFAGNADDGLHLHGASKVRVLGNYFGVKKDGVTPAANGKDIEVTSAPAASREAIGNSIGTTVSAEAAASPQCDRGCNLISGAVSSGIDLEGDGGLEAPAVATTIAGNYIGLNASGSAAIPNALAGVRVGQAAQTVIGGPKAGEANRIDGGETGVLAGPVAPDLVVRGNLIGGGTAAPGVLAPPDDGVLVDSGELPSAALEAVIAGNTIEMEGGTAVGQRGFGATIAGNEITGAQTGIETSEFTSEHGNLIQGNSLEAIAGSGILVENDFNEILGNEINGAGTAGIRIDGTSLPFGVSENLVGGDAAASENVVNSSAGAAIEIADLEETENEVARNRGSGNGGLFVDLVAASPATEPNGPNKGIKPPILSAASTAIASGSGAEAGATVRVFGKQSAAAGEISSFLGEATADATGNWEVIYGSAIPGGTRVTASQTGVAGGSSELAAPLQVAGAASGGGAGGDGGDGGGGGAAPIAGGGPAGQPRLQTKILRSPKKRTRRTVVRFEFESNVPGSRFLCRLDDKPFDLCRSPRRYRHLQAGRHVFEVRAVAPAGRVDPTPAKVSFVVVNRAR